MRCPTKRAMIQSRIEALEILAKNRRRPGAKPSHVQRCQYCGAWHIVGDHSTLFQHSRY